MTYHPESSVEPPLRVCVDWTSVAHWASGDSGDVVHVTEGTDSRCVVALIDVQGSGSGARSMGRSLASLLGQLSADGQPAELMAQATNEALFSRRRGRVSASVLVADIEPTGSCAIAHYGDIRVAGISPPPPTADFRLTHAGTQRGARPAVLVHQLVGGAPIILASDGLAASNDELDEMVHACGSNGRLDSRSIVESAVQRDHGRPHADMTAIVLSTGLDTSLATASRRGSLSFSMGRRPDWRIA